MHRIVAYTSLVVLCSTLALAQITTHQSPPTAQVTVPRLVRFSGTAQDSVGKPLNGVLGITFSLHQAQRGGAAAWIETQNVKADAAGRYSALLGASKADGLPTEVFTSGEAKWLGVQVHGQLEQPRVLLLSVPYALKAADAETLGGKPASAFVTAQPKPASSSPVDKPQSATSPNAINPAITGTGTTNFLARWTSNTNLGSSIMFQSSINNVGIGTTSPGAKLDVRSTLTTGANVAIGAHVASPAGTAGSFDNSAGGKILSGRAAGIEKFSVDGAGNVSLLGSINGGFVVQPTTNVQVGANIIGGFTGNKVGSGIFSATIAGGGEIGSANIVNGNFGAIGGGLGNRAGVSAWVGAGNGNSANGAATAVGGGVINKASGFTSTVPGGYSNAAVGDYSLASGAYATAVNQGSFVWGDASTVGFGTIVSDTAQNQFVARASGGVTFYTASNLSTGVTVAAGSGSWASVSDRNVKANFAAVDGETVLARLAAMPILTWNYKTQDAAIRHMGPMAQDFRAAFGLGEDDKRIGVVDSEGVALAAIQALHSQLQQVKEDRDKLAAVVQQLQTRMAALEKAAKQEAIYNSAVKIQ